MDSLGSFYVIDYKLVWQKWYALDDKAALNKMLKSNDFTSDLDILKFGTSVVQPSSSGYFSTVLFPKNSIP